MEELVEQVRSEHLKTGRDIREICDCLRDEGHIDCTDDELEQLVEMARPQ